MFLPVYNVVLAYFLNAGQQTEKTQHREIKDMFTRDLRQFQSSTRGSPAGRTAFSTWGPLFNPNRSFPISLILLSMCVRWAMASASFFWASNFMGEPSGALRNCHNRLRNALINIYGYIYIFDNEWQQGWDLDNVLLRLNSNSLPQWWAFLLLLSP